MTTSPNSSPLPVLGLDGPDLHSPKSEIKAALAALKASHPRPGAEAEATADQIAYLESILPMATEAGGPIQRV